MSKFKGVLTILLILVLVGLSLALTQVQAAEEPEAVLGGGGPMPALLFLDLVELNRILLANGYGPLDSTIFLMGGGGFGGAVKDLRFGGLGAGGEVSSILGQKVAKLSIGFGGFMVERGLFAGERYSLSLGVVIGGGGAGLSLLDHRSDSFEDAIGDPPNTSLTRRFFAIETYVGIDFALLDWIMLKVNLGYLWTFGEPWKQGGLPLPGPPESLNAPLVQIMIAFVGREEPEKEALLPEAQESEAKAVIFVKLLSEGRMEEAVSMFSKQMAAALPPEKLKAVWDDLIGKVGEFKEITKTRLTEEAGYTVVYVSCRFAKASLDIKVVFNKEGEIDGLWFI